MGKVIYTAEPTNASKSCKAAGVELTTHYKNMYNVAQAVKGMPLRKAFSYLEAVLEKKRCIPFRRYTGCIGRTYRAHGRISAYASSPCHVQMICEEKEENVE